MQKQEGSIRLQRGPNYDTQNSRDLPDSADPSPEKREERGDARVATTYDNIIPRMYIRGRLSAMTPGSALAGPVFSLARREPRDVMSRPGWPSQRARQRMPPVTLHHGTDGQVRQKKRRQKSALQVRGAPTEVSPSLASTKTK